MSNIALRARRIACRAARKGSFIRNLAHSFVFSLIFIRRFSLFSIKNAISVFLCNFMLIFQYASNTDGINYVRLPLFEPLFRPRGISLALPRHICSASKALRGFSDVLQGASERSQGTCGRLLMQLTGQRRRPTRIKIDKLRILYNFPGKQYVEKAPATFTPAPKPPFTQEKGRHLPRP